jgi:MFS family permease
MGFLILKDTEKKDLSLPKREVQPFGSLDLPFYASASYVNIAFGTLNEKIGAIRDDKAGLRYKFTKYVLIFFLSVFIFNLGSSLTFTPLSAWMITILKFDESYIFWIYLSYYLILTISYLFVGKSIDKYGNRKMAFLGLSAKIIAYILFIAISIVILPELGYLIGLLVILGISGLSISFVKVVFSNIFPRLTGEENLGEMLAIYSIIGSSAGIIGSFLSGIIAESSVFGYFFLFLISVGLTGLSFLIFLLVKQLK